MNQVRGRIAPTPSGELHLGHAATFLRCQQSVREQGGELLLRIEDLDQQRCKPEYIQSAIDDLKVIGIECDFGPEAGGPDAPYIQSQRLDLYKSVWRDLYDKGLIYPCKISRKQLRDAKPRTYENEIIFPVEMRPETPSETAYFDPGEINWRFRVPQESCVSFYDHEMKQEFNFNSEEHFGDFLVWRRDGFPSYELAVVADDHAMQISEVIRGQDLLLSTARQILIYEALGWELPKFSHCELLKDEAGERLSKTVKSLSLRTLIDRGQDIKALLKTKGFDFL